MRRDNWLLILDYSIAWTIALAMYALVRGVGTIEADGVQMPIGLGMLLSPVFGTVLGLVFGFSQLNFERLYNQRKPLFKLILLRIILSLFVLVIVSTLAYAIFKLVLNYSDLRLIDFLIDPPIFVFYVYVLAVDFLISLIRQVSLMLGKGTLRKLIKGQFYIPREEERIFMFLDLRSSTEMAERLGHFKYSQMIQDCFDDLAVVTKTQAEIYQYVGDEAVLTWTVDNGLKNENCVKAYFLFQEQMKARKDHYESKYGMIPFFKASINIGKVMVAEVGKNKKEIAYHGDCINTTARIQGMCNEFGKRLLISEYLNEALGNQHEYHTEHMGQVRLRGKAADVAIYSVS